MTLAQAIRRATERGYLVTFTAMPPKHVALHIYTPKGTGAERRFEEGQLERLPDELIARELLRTCDGLAKYAIQQEGETRIINVITRNGEKGEG